MGRRAPAALTGVPAFTPMPQRFRRMVFCDFDGTITVNETLRKVLLTFIPETARRILAELDAGTRTLREGVQELVAALPSRCRDAIVELVAAEPLRPGLEEFLGWLERNAIPFVVVSSGFRFYIEARLAPWRDRIHAIHALEVDTSGETMTLRLEHDHPREAMPKEWVLRSYACDERIAIGDSLSDFEMARAADRVFARDRLLRHLQEQGAAVTPYEDFHDVLRALSGEEAQRLG